MSEESGERLEVELAQAKAEYAALEKVYQMNRDAIADLKLMAESYRAILAFYAALSNVPLTEIIDAYQSGGTVHDCLLKYTERARAALDTYKT